MLLHILTSRIEFSIQLKNILSLIKIKMLKIFLIQATFLISTILAVLDLYDYKGNPLACQYSVMVNAYQHPNEFKWIGSNDGRLLRLQKENNKYRHHINPKDNFLNGEFYMYTDDTHKWWSESMWDTDLVISSKKDWWFRLSQYSCDNGICGYSLYTRCTNPDLGIYCRISTNGEQLRSFNPQFDNHPTLRVSFYC